MCVAEVMSTLSKYLTVLSFIFSAICRLQKVQTSRREISSQNILLPLTLICDNITDAGTLGTLIRSAAVASCKTVLIARGNYYRYTISLTSVMLLLAPCLVWAYTMTATSRRGQSNQGHKNDIACGESGRYGAWPFPSIMNDVMFVLSAKWSLCLFTSTYDTTSYGTQLSVFI